VGEEGAAVVQKIAWVLPLLLCGLAAGTHAYADDDADDAKLKDRCPGFAEWSQQNAAYKQTLPKVTTPTNPALSARFLRMGEEDQRARDFNILSDDKKALNNMFAVDRRNLKTVKAIIAAHGVPTPRQIGSDGMGAFWLIVQHANDFKFQAQMLRTFEGGNFGIQLSDMALLKDRVLMHEGKPQIYGSQFNSDGDKWVLYDLEDPSHVDERRKSMRLMPFDMYKCAIAVLYEKPTT
jgi:hypothetical protein